MLADTGIAPPRTYVGLDAAEYAQVRDLMLAAVPTSS